MSREQLYADIQNLVNQIRNTRKQERQVAELENSNALLYSQPAVKKNALQSHLERLLPPELIPSNVGDISEVSWGFFTEVDFDLGQDPVFDSEFYAEKDFKVTSEAALLVTRIYRDNDDADLAGFEAPLTLTIRDNQSSRQFMDRGVPLQSIPTRGYFYELPVPFLLYPAARATLELKCWLPSGIQIATEGSGVQRFTLYGAKVRVQSPEAILKTMFQKHNG